MDPPEERAPETPPIVPFLKRRKWTILACTGATIILAALVTLVWPRSYDSTATVLVEPQGKEGGDIPGLAILERVEQTSTLDTEAQLVRSRRVLEAAVDSLDLHVTARVDDEERRPAEVLPGFVAGPDAVPGDYRLKNGKEGWTVLDAESGKPLARGRAGEKLAFAGLAFGLPSAGGPSELELHVRSFPRAVAGARARVGAAPASRESNVLQVDCKGSTPEDAMDLCDQVSRGYVRLRAGLQKSEATVTADFLRGQVASYGQRLTAAEDSLEQFERENRGVALEEQASEEVRNYAETRAQRDQLEAERRALSSTLSRIEGEPGGTSRYRQLASFPALLQNQAVANLLTNLATLQNQRSELAQRRTEANPELAALDDRISDIDRQLATMARSYERSLQSKVTSLNRILGASSGRLADLPERQVGAERLRRQVNSLTQLHDLLQTRLREAEVAEAVTQPKVKVVDAASMPLDASSPKPLLNLALALILGLGLGVVVGMVREHADRRIHDRGELAGLTRLPVLSLIPNVDPPGPLLSVRKVDLETGAAEVEGTIGAGGVPVPVLRERRLQTRSPHENGHGVALEAFRSLGSDLSFVARRLASGDIRSLAVTSAGRGDGKTMVSCNLALTRAGHGIPTLLIDADMRAGGVGRFFDLDPSPGLRELLTGEATTRQARRTLRIGEADTLSVMPSGEPTPDAAELLETSYFEAMLAGAQAVYDLVVIDTPPLNILPDTAAVVACVDAVLVVVREDVTPRDALEFTLERLRRAGAPVVGIVYNDVSLPDRHYAYGGYAYA